MLFVYIFLIIIIGWAIGGCILFVAYTIYDSLNVQSGCGFIRSSKVEEIKRKLRKKGDLNGNV